MMKNYIKPLLVDVLRVIAFAGIAFVAVLIVYTVISSSSLVRPMPAISAFTIGLSPFVIGCLLLLGLAHIVDNTAKTAHFAELLYEKSDREDD